MTKVTKYVVAKYDYEYNDNWYDHNDNFDAENLLVFDNKDDAEAHKKDLSKEAISDYPTEYNLSNIQDNIPNLGDVRNFLKLDDDEDWDVNVSEEFLEGEKWDKLYTYIKDCYYKIIEIEVDENNPLISINWKTEYYNKTMTGIVEDDKFLLHSPTEPALVEKDDWDVYNTYYLKGKKYENVAQWKSDSRKYKIGNLLSENEKEE